MTICRVRKDPNNPYVMLNKGFLENPNISLKLKGFLAYCLSKPDHWKFFVKQLVSVLKEGKDAIYAIIQEGIEHGYISKEKQRIKGKFESVEYVIMETPIQKILTVSGNPDTVNPDTENPPLVSNDPKVCIEKKKKPRTSSSPPSPEAQEIAFLLLETIRKIKPDLKSPNMDRWVKDIDAMLRLDHRKPESIRKVINWLPSDPFWFGNTLWARSLRKQFDRLEIKMFSKKSSNYPEENRKIADNIKIKYPNHPNITYGINFIEFKRGDVTPIVSHIKFTDNGFQERIFKEIKTYGLIIS